MQTNDANNGEMWAIPMPDGWLLTRSETLHPRGRLRDGVAARRFVRVRPRVFAVAQEWQALKPHQRYRERVRAHTLIRPADTLCLESAAVAHGFPVFGEPVDIHVLRPPGSPSRRRGGVVEHSGHDERSVVRVEGRLATGPVDTVLDLARVLNPAFALAVVDASIARGRPARLSLTSLRDAASTRTSTRNDTQLSWLLENATDLAESPGETVSRATIDWLGFAAPLLQQEFTWAGGVDRSDFFWPDVDAIGESDGYMKYLDVPPAEAARRLTEEKRREDRLRRRVRALTRWDWADAIGHANLRRKLVEAGVPLLRAPEHRGLATLRTARRIGH